MHLCGDKEKMFFENTEHYSLAPDQIIPKFGVSKKCKSVLVYQV